MLSPAESSQDPVTITKEVFNIAMKQLSDGRKTKLKIKPALQGQSTLNSMGVIQATPELRLITREGSSLRTPVSVRLPQINESPNKTRFNYKFNNENFGF